MYRIAVSGTENSHALAFTRLINRDLIVPDFKIVGIYGTDSGANAQITDEFPDIAVASSPDAFSGKIDGVMVTARHGDKHLPYARAYLEAGLPAFIDKPFTVTPDDAAELVAIAKRSGSPICGGSCCGFVDDVRRLRDEAGKLGRMVGGSVTAPISMSNEYGGFFFYSQHLVQIAGELFGYDVKSVMAFARENEVTAVFRYADFDVSAHWGSHVYSATVIGEAGVRFSQINIGEGYANEVRGFAEMVRTRKMTQTFASLTAPVAILNAVWDSIRGGEETAVKPIVI